MGTSSHRLLALFLSFVATTRATLVVRRTSTTLGDTADAYVASLIASLPRKARISPGLAPAHGIASLGAVAEKTVTAKSVVRDVVARISALIARVSGAGDPVVAIDRRPRLAVAEGVADLRSVAVRTVAARRIGQALA